MNGTKQYDLAVVEYAKNLFENSVWGEPSEAFKNNAKENEDKVKLPLISVYRSGLDLTSLRNFALFKRGSYVRIPEDDVLEKERILPLTYIYQFDCWANNSDDASQLFGELLFELLDNPKITTKHAGMDNSIDNYFTVTDIADNSDITSYITRGSLYRYTITAQLNGHLAKIERKDRLYIEPVYLDFKGNELK